MVFALSYGPLAATAGVRDGTMAPGSWTFDPFSMGGRKPFSLFPLPTPFQIYDIWPSLLDRHVSCLRLIKDG